jgi:hypothetical protein
MFSNSIVIITELPHHQVSSIPCFKKNVKVNSLRHPEDFMRWRGLTYTLYAEDFHLPISFILSSEDPLAAAVVAAPILKL